MSANTTYNVTRDGSTYPVSLNYTVRPEVKGEPISVVDFEATFDGQTFPLSIEEELTIITHIEETHVFD